MIDVRQAQVNVPNDDDLFTLDDMRRFLNVVSQRCREKDNDEDWLDKFLVIDILNQLIHYKLNKIAEQTCNPHVRMFVEEAVFHIWSVRKLSQLAEYFDQKCRELEEIISQNNNLQQENHQHV